MLNSPALFNVYTDDLNNLITETKVGCHKVGQCVNHLSYADDLVLLSRSVKALQQLRNFCSKYAKYFDMAFNSVEIKCMVFRLRAAPRFNVQSLALGETTPGFLDEFTYLGHVFHNSLSDVFDVKKQLQKLNTIGNVALRKFGACLKDVKGKNFRSHCSIIYSSYLWSDFTVASMRKFRVCHNDISYRMIDVRP